MSKVALLIESDYYEPEIHYYDHRFQEAGIQLDVMSRMWGQERITFFGHEIKMPLECSMSFEPITDDELRTYDAVIVPSGIVADRLRFTEDVNKIPPATDFIRRAFGMPEVIKGIICHGMWLVAPLPELVRGRPVVVHNNLIGDAKNMGAIYTDKDLVVDRDLVTARTGKHCHLLAGQIIAMINERQAVTA